MSTCEVDGTCDIKCSTLDERIALNKATPCEEAFNPVFPAWMVGKISLSVLFVGMTIIGYGISLNKHL